MNTIKVDIWSDIACPWCFIGKRRLETALKNFEHSDAVVIEYHSYELIPDTPVDFEGTPGDFLMQHKGMEAGQVQQMYSQSAQMAQSEGLNFDVDATKHTKTLKAHELLHFAKAHGKQVEMVDRLFQAYFEDGKHVGQVSQLAALAAEVGLDADEATRALESGQLAAEVAADISQARDLGITGVPFFVFNEKYAISGAQAPDGFLEVLNKVAAEAAAETGDEGAENAN